MKNSIRVLVLGCGGSPGVNFIRSLRLAKKFFYIVGVDADKYFLQISPVDKKYLLANEKDEKKYLKKLVRIIQKERINFIHAQPDSKVKILSDYRENIPSTLFLPSKTAVNVFQDKWRTFVELNKHNVAVPKTQRVGNEKNLKKIFEHNKKTVWLRASRGAGGKASLPVKSFEQATMWIEYWLDKGLTWSDFLVSELLPGKEVSFLSLWKDGRLVCSQQKERISWVQANISPSGVGGTSAVQKTSSYESVNDICTKTILAVDKKANGVYVVDVRENEKGTFCVMEVNPGRFFTTSLFFPTAGVNFPFIYVQLALDLPTPKVKQYNALPGNLYWIRVTDSNTGMVKEKDWEYNTV